MTIKELKKRVEEVKQESKRTAGTAVLSSEQGPIGISWIEKIILILEDQQKQIDELKAKPASFA
jgi:hypothetical protein